jgi:crotonobetainyl-CoA:carnitine CoA-transferase CaiB-like acyl-CoA transferase
MPDFDPPKPLGPLAGVRVLDMTSVVLGPMATQILGDYGADIIKIESPSGDLMRLNGVSLHRGLSSIFLTLNRNKRSLALNLQIKEGAAPSDPEGRHSRAQHAC